MKKPKRYKPKSYRSGKVYQAEKKTNFRAMYDKDWNRYRFRFLHYNPLCYVCGDKATVVDHIVAHKGDPVKFKALNNHMAMCKFHHDMVTGKFDRNNPPLTKEKIEWINNQRKSLSVEVKVKELKDYTKGTSKNKTPKNF